MIWDERAKRADSIRFRSLIDSEIPLPNTCDTYLYKAILNIPTQEIHHMQRVGHLTNIFAAQVVQTPQYQEYTELFLSIGEMAFYHDIGKAWISPEILLKAEKLSSDEYEQIMMHPVYARKFLESHPCLFEDGVFLNRHVYNMAVYHHESWNGRGYPYGLRQEQIPLIARMTSICDAYDAITNSRPYRQARTHLEACSEIERWSGHQFDPDLVKVFLDCSELIEEKMFEQQL